jgi:ADP-ribose pyrophosphatase
MGGEPAAQLETSNRVSNLEETVSSRTLHMGKSFSFKTDMVRQYRYAAGRELLEIPAGTLERGEDPDACAARELREETGYVAKTWRRLLRCYMAPGYSSEVIHFYVAEGLEPVGSSPEEDESITVERVTFDAALRMIEDNTIVDAKTVAGVLSYLTRASP